jgi:hypothetical protein
MGNMVHKSLQAYLHLEIHILKVTLSLLSFATLVLEECNLY